MAARHGWLGRLALAGAAACLFTASARAEKITEEGPLPSDPIMAWAEQMQPANQFTLNSAQDVDRVQFHHEHMISVCAPRANHADVDAAAHGASILVTADGEAHTVTPGNCLMVEAKKISVRPAGPLANNTDLVGSVRVMR